MSENTSLLSALRLNAFFSGTSALMLLIAGHWVAPQLGLDSAIPVYVTAVLLGLFGLQLWNIVRTKKINPPEIIGIIVGDIAWVIGSVVFVAIFYQSMTSIGVMLVDVIAIVVLIFAILQIRGLKALRLDAST